MKHDHITYSGFRPFGPGSRRRDDRRPQASDPVSDRTWERRMRRPEDLGPRGPFGPRGEGVPGGRPFGHSFEGAAFGGPSFRGPSFEGAPFDERGDGRRHRGPGRGPGRRAGRGDIRAAVLLLLSEQPMHGYQLIQEIAERSGGRWRPSPGAIYPALSLLEDEGLVLITAEGGRKLASLTEAGTTYVTDNAEQLGTPFDDAATRPQHPGRALRGAMEALGAAAGQVARTGTEEQTTAALAVLEAARRDLYLILAGAAPTTGTPTGAPTTTADPTDTEPSGPES